MKKMLAIAWMLPASASASMADTSEPLAGSGSVGFYILLAVLVVAAGLCVWMRRTVKRQTEELRKLVQIQERHLKDKDTLLAKARIQRMELTQMAAIGRQINDMMEHISMKFGLMEQVLAHHYRTGNELLPLAEESHTLQGPIKETIDHMMSSKHLIRDTLEQIDLSISSFREVAAVSFDDSPREIDVKDYIEKVAQMFFHSLEKRSLEVRIDVPSYRMHIAPGALCQAILQMMTASISAEGEGVIHLSLGFDRKRVFLIYRDERDLVDPEVFINWADRLQPAEDPVLDHLLMAEYVVTVKLGGSLRMETHAERGTELNVILPVPTEE